MRILIADDDGVSRRLLEKTLVGSGHEVISVADGAAAVTELSRPDCPRLAILDWMMPGVDGLGVCRRVRQSAPAYIYLILLTSRDGQQDKVAALDAGADDFLTKPFNAEELRARLRSAARIIDLQAGLLAAQEALHAQAMRDDMTGLWNRRMILEELGRELNRVRHEKRPLAVAMADIDFFKQINDAHGHAGGDTVLHEVATRLKSELRDYDSLARYGGEEFLFLLPGCDAAAGRAIAERVRKRIESTPICVGGGELPVTVSIGLASTLDPEIDPVALINVADEALYRAKAAGRNRVES